MFENTHCNGLVDLLIGCISTKHGLYSRFTMFYLKLTELLMLDVDGGH